MEFAWSLEILKNKKFLLVLCLRGLTAMTHPCRGCDPGSTPGVGATFIIFILPSIFDSNPIFLPNPNLGIKFIEKEILDFYGNKKTKKS